MGVSEESTVSISRVERVDHARYQQCRLLLAGILLGLLFGCEDGGSMFLRNACELLPHFTTSHPRRLYHSYSTFGCTILRHPNKSVQDSQKENHKLNYAWSSRCLIMFSVYNEPSCQDSNSKRTVFHLCRPWRAGVQVTSLTNTSQRGSVAHQNLMDAER
jgi:hypothetical protein